MTGSVRQTLNFYTDEFRPPRLPPEVASLQRQFSAVLLTAAVAAGLLYALTFAMHSGLVDEQASGRQLNEEIAREQAQRPPKVADAALVRQLELARGQLENSRKVLAYLSQEGIATRSSLTAKVGNLADAGVAGVWLSGFTLSDKGRVIQLRGNAREAQQVSAYLTALAQQPAYGTVAFREIRITEESGQNWLNFVLDTRPPAQTADAAAGGGR